MFGAVADSEGELAILLGFSSTEEGVGSRGHDELGEFHFTGRPLETTIDPIISLKRRKADIAGSKGTSGRDAFQEIRVGAGSGERPFGIMAPDRQGRPISFPLI